MADVKVVKVAFSEMIEALKLNGHLASRTVVTIIS
jgi:hypothetical protein